MFNQTKIVNTYLAIVSPMMNLTETGSVRISNCFPLSLSRSATVMRKLFNKLASANTKLPSKIEEILQTISFTFSKSSKRFLQINSRTSNVFWPVFFRFFSFKYLRFRFGNKFSFIKQIIFFFSIQSELSKTEEM